jgi:hypothetical protein
LHGDGFVIAAGGDRPTARIGVVGTVDGIAVIANGIEVRERSIVAKLLEFRFAELGGFAACLGVVAVLGQCALK